MGKKKSHHRHSRSRSRSKSPRKRDKRTRSKDRHRSEKRRHRSSSSDEYSRHQRSPERVSRSQQRRHSRSRSNSRDARHRRSKPRSRSRDRTRSRRERSRSRNRSRERTSRHNNLRERKQKQRSISPCDSGSKESEKSSHRDITKDIPNFDSMTPSERIKAKIKLMLEKSASDSTDQLQVYAPTPSQLASIESDAFESVSFSSTRAPGLREKGSNNGSLPPTKTDLCNPAAIDPSEYAPQVVELQDTMSDDDSYGSGSLRKEVESPASEGVDVGSVHQGESMTLKVEAKEDKKSRWLQRLQKLQEKFKPPHQ